MSPRATPLPADERRAQILAVSEPLVLEHGSRVTTRQIADAAGVAEGTLFRIFPTKIDLLHEVVFAALDPTPTITSLAAIDPALDLDSRLEHAIASLRLQVERITGLMVAMRDLANEQHGHDADRLQQTFGALNDQLNNALATVLAPDGDQLRLPVADAAAWIWTTVLVSSHPLLRSPGLTDAATLTDVVLHGIHRAPGADQAPLSSPAKES